MKIALLLMTLLILPAAAATADTVPNQFELVAVKFTGVESVSESELAKTLAAQTPPIWKVWQPSPVLSAEDLEEDRLRIQQFYRNNGYYQTEVEIAVTVSGRRTGPKGRGGKRPEFSVRRTGRKPFRDAATRQGDLRDH